ncbi:MAG: sugar ABC transporter permease [Defluviitaleaceae bacterium]|nr:sugar ABC transporter permease [Defluviitaleaceae bacterium]MCL2275215.1 sugar ABC transporter permease [Defluviitaleaceae bacterium]
MTKYAPFFLLIPWFIGITVFRVYPMISSFYYSLFDFQPVLRTREFVGFDNYARLLFRFPHFWDSVRATLRYVLWGTPMVLIAAFFIAFVLNFKLKGINLFRTAYYVPSILGGNVAVAILWSQLFSGNGPVNQVLGIFGVEPISWIRDTTFAPFTLIFLSAWQFGSVMLIFLAALQNVSPSLYEAASIDGASKWRQLFKITLPIITPVLLFNTVNVLIRHFQEFNAPYLITNRGPLRATDFLNVLIYDYAFRRLEFGFALAMTWFLLAAIGLLTVILFFSSKYWVHYSD